MQIEHVACFRLFDPKVSEGSLPTLLLVVRLESSNVDPFKDIGTTLDHCSSIGVDFNDCARSNGCGSEFALDLFVNDNHLISRLTVFTKATQIVAQQVLINLELSSLLWSLQVCNQRHREEHASMECE